MSFEIQPDMSVDNFAWGGKRNAPTSYQKQLQVELSSTVDEFHGERKNDNFLKRNNVTITIWCYFCHGKKYGTCNFRKF